MSPRLTFSDLNPGGPPAPAPAAVGLPDAPETGEGGPGPSPGISISGINQILDDGWGMLQRIDKIIGQLLPVWDFQKALKRGELPSFQSIPQGGDPRAAQAQPAQAQPAQVDPAAMKEPLIAILNYVKEQKGDIPLTELISLIEGVHE